MDLCLPLGGRQSHQQVLAPRGRCSHDIYWEGEAEVLHTRRHLTEEAHCLRYYPDHMLEDTE